MNFSEITALIEGRAQESATLEFKAGAALARERSGPAELVKDITALANAAGGRIVYGISEGKGDAGVKFAESLSPVLDPKATGDWITQVVAAQTGPRLTRFSVLEIAVPDGKNGERVLVVDVDAGDTAHQSSLDHRYYQRVGALVLPMEDFQVRDVMGRRTTPKIDVKLIRSSGEQTQERHLYQFWPVLRNDGAVTLERWRLVIDFPQLAIDDLRLGQQMLNGVERQALTLDSIDCHRITYNGSSQQFVRGGHADLHPGEWLRLDNSIGLPTIPLVVTQATYRALADVKAAIKWRLFIPNNRPIEGSLAFTEWCNF